MEPRSLKFLADSCSGRLEGGSPDTLVSRVCTDSRQLRPGDLFVALRGERFDGHDFVAEAVSKAVAVVVEKDFARTASGNCALIRVADTHQAFGHLAGAYRSQFSIPFIAVGGSNGKTTTKELIASVLKRKLETLWSEASFNNDVGVPATLLRLESRHQAAVLEVGTNHPGELAPLVRLVRPQYGVIASIGREHLEYFGDLNGVLQEEGWLAELLPETGKLLVKGDDASAGALAARSKATLVRVGFSDANEWRVHGTRLDKQGVTFRVEGPDSAYNGEYRSSLLGRHQALNSLFAIALGAELGLSREQIAEGLSACQPAKMRLQLWEANGVRVLDDAYNANADSMLVALQTMRDLPCRGRRVAVLGDMAELGKHSEAAHEEVGRRAAELGIGQLFAVGKMAAVLARGARSAGLNRVLEFPGPEAAGPAVKQFVREGDLLLLKASRATRLERVAEFLRNSDVQRKAAGVPNGRQER